MQISKDAPVMITGATGYVAGWIVKKLLDEGHTVHAPVRSPDDKEKTKYLDALAAKSAGTIRYFKADLLEEGSYDEAMRGCALVLHTASPFTTKVDDPQKQLVDPALKGTRNVLNSVNRTTTVKRVVLTSSCAAIYGDAKDTLDYPNQTMTEEQWNETSSLEHQPYSYSKTVAEREAWKLAGEQTRWDLVVVNPPLVVGPGINPHATSESFSLMEQMGDGTFKMGAPHAEIGLVDVRDLAVGHYRAGFTPAAHGRNIIGGHNSSFLKMAEKLRAHYGDKYPFPKSKLPKWLIWLVAPASGLTRRFVARNIGYPFQFDNSKSKRELGMTYRPLQTSLVEFFEQLLESGRVKRA